MSGAFLLDEPNAGTAVARDNRHFTLIQALRGIAAFWVVLFHISAGGHIARLEAQLPAWADDIFRDGHFGVAIFFALSGFVIAHSIRGAAITSQYLGRFMLRRSIRLDPPYWASIAFFVLTSILAAHVKAQPVVLPTGPQVLAHLFYLQTLLGFPQIDWVYWTLTYEVQFYLSLILLVMVAQKISVPPTLAVMLPLAGTIAIWLGLMPVVPGLFLNLWHTFLAGVLAYWSKDDRNALCLFAGVCGISILLSPDAFTVLSLATAVGLHVAYRGGFIYRGLNWRWMQFLGAISYSLYLTHNPVVGAVSYVSRLWIGSDLLTLIFSVAASVGTAALFWRFVERPALALAHHVRLKPRYAAAPAAVAPTHSPPFNSDTRQALNHLPSGES